MKSVFFASLLVLCFSLPAFGQISNETQGGLGTHPTFLDDLDVSIEGNSAGSSITTGDYNSFYGDMARQATSSGSYNTFVGMAAGFFNNSASDNTFIGALSGGKNTTGTDNTFVGTRAGQESTATDNTFVGTEAGLNNTSGSDNTFIGEEAGEANTTGRDNVFVGEDAGFLNTDGDDNTALGNQALRSNTTGEGNSAVGNEALWDNQTAPNNTAIGNYAGTDNGVGHCNTYLGASAGSATEHADFNTFVGFGAGMDNNRTNSTSNANRNTYVGAWAGQTNREGQDNVVIGAHADMSNQDESNGMVACSEGTSWLSGFINSSSGDNSVSRVVTIGTSGFVKGDDAIGVGYSVTSNGTGGIAMGSGASSTHAEAIAIGYGAQSRAANQVILGNASTTSWEPGDDGVTSLGALDYRFSGVYAAEGTLQADAGNDAVLSLHANGQLSPDDSWKLRAAEGGDFTISTATGLLLTGEYTPVLTVSHDGNVLVAGDLTLNSDERLKTEIVPLSHVLEEVSQLEPVSYLWREDLQRGSDRHFGLIAQEVAILFPELVSESDNGILSVNYFGFIPLLIDSVKGLREEAQEQEDELTQLRLEVEAQRAELDLMKSQMQRLIREMN